MSRRGPLITLASVLVLAAIFLIANTMVAKPAKTTAAPGVAPTSTPASTPAAAVHALYAGRSSGDQVTVAIAVNGRKAAAYLNPGDASQVLLQGSVNGNQVSLTGNKGASLTGSLSGLDMFGTVTANAALSFPLSAELSPRPAGVYRSRDGGRHWDKLAIDAARECSIGEAFVTSLVIDPDDHRMVWAGVEIDGVFRSRDGGDTWTHLETGLYDPDIHAVTIAATQPKRLYASTAREMFVSDDLGDTWQPLGIKEKWPLPYARGMAVKADDPGVLFAGCGETTTGGKGHVLRTANFGETWEVLPLPTQPNATVWGLATHPANANRIVAFSLFGEVYVTEDAGASWRKIAREFGEIRAAVWVPKTPEKIMSHIDNAG